MRGDAKAAMKRQVLSREFRIRNQFGIHARPAALIVKEASKYESDVSIERGTNRVSGKSIIGLMTLAAGQGVRIRVTADGPDAADALDALQKLIEDQKFYEE